MFRPRHATLALSLALAVAVRADEFPEYPDDPSAFVTVINARDYDEEFETVEDVLGKVAGVNVRRFGGLGAHSTVSIRGSKGEQVLVLVDGMRLNSAQRSSVDLSTLPLRSVERIDVVRGGGSARYGSDAVGGVISITTRSADTGDQAAASLTAGRFETLGADVFAARKLENVSASVGYSRLRSENDFRFDLRKPDGSILWQSVPDSRNTRLNADFVENTSWLQLTRQLGRSSELVLSANGFWRDNGQPGSTLSRPAVDVSDEQLSCTNTDERSRRWLAGARFRETALGEGSFEASFSHRYERNELDDPDRCLFLVSDGETRFQTVENETSWDLRYAARRRRLGPVTVQGRASAGARLDQVRPGDSDDQRRWVWNAFAQQDVGFFAGRLRVIPALGFEGANTSSGLARASGFQTPQEVDLDDDPEWLPRIGLIFRIAPGLRLKANYLKAYRRPNFTELFHPDQGFVRGNPRLDSEQSWNFDVGFELAHEEGAGPLSDLRLEAAYFHRDIDESIEWVFSDRVVQPQNTGSARARGLELGGSFAVLERLRLSASYTHLDTELRDTGNDLPHSPRNQIFTRADLPLGPLRLWGEYRYEDESKLAPSLLRGVGSFSLTAPEVHQIDAGVAVRPSRVRGLRWVPEGISVSSEWINLTNEQRIDALGLPLPDQTLWYLTVRGEFR